VIGKKAAQEILDQIKKSKRHGELPNKETCDAIIQQADSMEITNMIRQLRHIRSENKKNHKSLNIADQKLLNYAERVLSSELATALAITMDEAVEKLNLALEKAAVG
jgi:CarD family transcriptional regulator